MSNTEMESIKRLKESYNSIVNSQECHLNFTNSQSFIHVSNFQEFINAKESTTKN